MMLNTIRKIAFYAHDALHRGKVRTNINDITEFYTTVPEFRDKVTAKRITELLKHATHSTAFYENYKNNTYIDQYPIMSKKYIQCSEDLFLHSGYVRSSLIRRQTSGSYGTPMSVYFSKNKFARQIAELIYYNRLAGLDIGDLYLNITTTRKNRVEKFLKNLMTINPTGMNEQWYDRTMRLLCRYKNTFIIGFPSVLYSLAQYIVKYTTHTNIRLRGIITIAEPLNSKVKEKIEEVFQCAVYNRYATMETGVIGHSTGADNTIHINQASYIVELLKFDCDEHVAEGEDGRIVVTDLFSYAMPLIRYETGDTAVLISKNKFGAEIIKNPEGRVVERIYRTDGSKVSWASIYDVMLDLPNTIQYQFIQETRKSYTLKIIAMNSFDTKVTVKDKLYNILGSDADIEIQFVNEIPPLPSGKRPAIMNKSQNGNDNYVKT